MSESSNNSAAGFELNHPTIVALLYLSSFIVGITGIVGLVLAYVWRGETAGGWETSHYTFHIRTFWIAIVASIVSAILSLILIGLLGFFLVGIWVIVRTVLALLQAQKKQPVPNPESLIW